MSARHYSPSEEPPIPDVRRCTKNTKAGSRCRRSRIGWPRNAELPNPQACHIHLTSEERQFDTAERERFWRTLEPHMEMRSVLMASDPACWSWPTPDLPKLTRMTDAERVAAMYAWQAGRCAVCVHQAEVTDHSHETGLVRGRLCRSCNALEGYGNLRRDVFVKYRERNPASIWCAKERYFNVVSGQFAAPQPRLDVDPWALDALDGVL